MFLDFRDRMKIIDVGRGAECYVFIFLSKSLNPLSEK